MLKSEALNLFEQDRAALARAIGVTPQAVSDWPDDLPPRIADRVIAAAVRKRKPVPENWLDEPDSSSQRAA